MNTYQCPVCGKEFKEFPSRVSRKGCCSGKCSSDPRFNFWNQVQKTTSCWIWTGSKSAYGYGQFMFRKQNWIASRFAWILTHGPIPDGLSVLHDCPNGDNPACVNPAHLWIGTQHENMTDAASKKRTASGTRNARAKINEEIVKKIRSEYVPKVVLQKVLAKKYGVSRTLVSAIIVRRAWRLV